jgi:thiol-disulfide isomerase/thioredoxin
LKKNVLLVFFATWCPACRAEVPLLIKINKKYNDKIEIIAVAIGQEERIIKKFIKKNKINYKILLDKKQKVAEDYDVRGIPLNILIDKEGVIKFKEHHLPKDIGKLIK